MFQRRLIAIVPLLLAALLVGCQGANGPVVVGSGVKHSEDRTVNEFTRIAVEGSANVEVTVGPGQHVTVWTDDNILPLIETKVRGETLVVSSTQPYRTRIGVRVTVSVPQLRAVSISGSGDVNVTGLHGEVFSAAIAGSGDVRASGAVQKVDASIRGSGNLHLGDLQAQTADVSIAGSGDVTVNASDSLAASIAGSGNVNYRGSPKVSKSVAGSGSVRQAG